ncbi:MAG TPA: sigma-70 family RNA polymerase sigma factor [Anaerolineaceae bacterium]|jgi:RNA polymerase sigma-70 factor (ECF subfamily)|nr:sigma-70 family RNA polymerase sigma factor [Anaerolineaceae bacterium]HNS07396.1 sigma-70 family RNA polymerase sigma factor [Anaerolineaceae bacterium]HNW14538.1 sigma-70 family RNA polymerase sigma factor [Anaerolineaceae bacterium]HPD61780.1 sigma-70 family RNA polymerase sigma factor [Anaerolineaceae bacterium]HQF68106.1 sigma-70 family RNA polymerase sigma factor [Anaerolineaceae bacterium]
MSAARQFPSEFVDRLIAGDGQAFNELVDQTSAGIYGLGLRMLGNAQDAEDMLQETFLKAHNALRGFEKRSSLYTWLYRIATNEALMMLRRRKSEFHFDSEPVTQEEAENGEEVVDWCCLPEKEFISEETRSELTRAAVKLSNALRMVFLLRDVRGFSTRETAEILQVNEEVVKTRLVRARVKLRDELSGYFRERLQGQGNNG